MRKFFIFLLVSLILCLPVLADLETDGAADPALPSSVEEVNNSEDWEITDIQTYSVSPITPSDASGLKQVLLQFLGDYDPVIVEYAYKNQNNTYYSYLREVQPDYVWMASFLLLLLFVYCLFRLGGALIG